MKILSFFGLLFLLSSFSFAQSMNELISKNEAKKILGYLASDQLKGRVNFTKEQLVAAEFIGNKFAEYGLISFPGFDSYYQPFRITTFSAGARNKLEWNAEKIDDSSFVFLSRRLYYDTYQLKDFRVIRLEEELPDSFLYRHWRDTVNVLFWIPVSANVHSTLLQKQVPEGVPSANILIVAAEKEPVFVQLSLNQKFISSVLYNVVGVLPGRTKPNEVIMFSAHYDHVDRDPVGNKGGIFNGANDDASGTTAVMLLASYFSSIRNNERTLIFCLFAGEELGMMGSTAFVKEIEPDSIKAVINIEMIGVPGIGNNAFFITGSGFSNLRQIIKRNIAGKGVLIKDESISQRDLFQRSDNYVFALKGIPSHSIMSSDDSESCYHQPCDVAKNIDYDNMVNIIRAIASGCKTLINGQDTPSRIK